MNIWRARERERQRQTGREREREWERAEKKRWKYLRIPLVSSGFTIILIAWARKMATISIVVVVAKHQATAPLRCTALGATLGGWFGSPISSINLQPSATVISHQPTTIIHWKIFTWQLRSSACGLHWTEQLIARCLASAWAGRDVQVM